MSAEKVIHPTSTTQLANIPTWVADSLCGRGTAKQTALALHVFASNLATMQPEGVPIAAGHAFACLLGDLVTSESVDVSAARLAHVEPGTSAHADALRTHAVALLVEAERVDAAQPEDPQMRECRVELERRRAAK